MLTELNWKTYANAAKKAAKIGDPRAEDFHDTARDRINQVYGYTSGDEMMNGNSTNVNARSASFSQPGTFYANAREVQSNQNINGRKYDKEYNREFDQQYDPEGNANIYDDEARKNYQRLHNTLSNYNKGNYQYIKGKGYQLKK
jgi:hypothetical protein